MKIMIASDIHGSARFCRETMRAWRRESPDRLLLLGDLLYHGPRNGLPEEYDPKAVAGMLNDAAAEGSVFSVRGNCEAEVDQAVLDFPVMAEYALVFWEDRLIFATHGHLYGLEHMPRLRRGDVLLAGHTHIPAFAEREGVLYVNPGSVSMPKNGTPHSYLILEDRRSIWKELSGEPFRAETLPKKEQL